MTAKVHYAPSGEWGQSRVACNRYYTTDFFNTGNKSKATCKHCLKTIKRSKNRT